MNYDIPYQKTERRRIGEELGQCDICGYYVPDRLLTKINVDEIKFACNECLDNSEINNNTV